MPGLNNINGDHLFTCKEEARCSDMLFGFDMPDVMVLSFEYGFATSTYDSNLTPLV